MVSPVPPPGRDREHKPVERRPVNHRLVVATREPAQVDGDIPAVKMVDRPGDLARDQELRRITIWRVGIDQAYSIVPPAAAQHAAEHKLLRLRSPHAAPPERIVADLAVRVEQRSATDEHVWH